MASKVTLDFCDDSIHFEERCNNLFSVISQPVNSLNVMATARVLSTARGRYAESLGSSASSTGIGGFLPHISPRSRLQSANFNAEEILSPNATIKAAVCPGTAPSFPQIDSTASVPLATLTTENVVTMMEKLNLSAYIPAFQVSRVDGMQLSSAVEERAIVAMGVTLLTKARLLYSRIQSYKLYGVPRELISPTTVLKANAAEDIVHNVGEEVEVVSARKETSISPKRSESPVLVYSHQQQVSRQCCCGILFQFFFCFPGCRTIKILFASKDGQVLY